MNSNSTKRDSRSNPHPYAIKTTSTGVLTRSNSAHSTHSTHHFVPSSPTKPKVNQTRQSEGHKYNHIPNEELPRPLPIPPNFASSGSPTKTEFEPHHETSFIGHMKRQSDTRHSLSQPEPLKGSVTAELPNDPRVWTPSQLSTYLTSSGDSSPSFAQDLATFIHLHKITSQRFLQLTESDLQK